MLECVFIIFMGPKKGTDNTQWKTANMRGITSAMRVIMHKAGRPLADLTHYYGKLAPRWPLKRPLTNLM